MLFKISKDGEDVTWLTTFSLDEAVAHVLVEYVLKGDDYDPEDAGLLPVVAYYKVWGLFRVRDDGTLKRTGYSLEEK
jgi:hypothetical protein